jgi:hypothetical protein
MRRASVVLAIVLPLALLGCRPATVSVAFTPEVGATYAYRYEIDATVTTTRDGEEPQVERVDTELVAEQEVQSLTADGARIRLELTREGGVPRTAVALVDRAGSLADVELVEDLDAAAFGIAGSNALVPTQLGGPPDRPLAPGDTWRVDQGDRHGSGRLERLGVIDDADVAVVRVDVSEDLARSVRAGASETRLDGTLHSGSQTSYDLDDGAIRRSRSWSRGTFAAELAPPSGVDAEPVHATIDYDVAVRITRIR